MATTTIKKMTILIPETLNSKFRKCVVDKYGTNRGVSKAAEEAISDWVKKQNVKTN